MRDGDDIVDVVIFGEQLGFDFDDGVVDGRGDTLHGGADAEDVFCADGAVVVEETLEGEALERWHGVLTDAAHGEVVQCRGCGQGENSFVHPGASGDVLLGMADVDAITDYGFSNANFCECDLMGFGDCFE